MSNEANINQLQPVAIMSNGANINQPQPVAIMSIGANINQPQPVAIMSIGANINHPMTQQIVYVSEYTGWSIFNILCCCLILGILAFVKSRETRNKKRFGDLQGALQASKSAKILNICATVIGIIIIIIAAILQATSTVKIYSYSND
jgi:heme/copper-type cytochrome/quinol oxidase subunit 2